MSIRLRLTLWYTGILAVMIIVLGIVLFLVLENNLFNSEKDNLKTQGDEVYKEMLESLDRTFYLRPDGTLGYQYELPNLNFLSTSYFLQVVNKYGELEDKSFALFDYEIPMDEETFDAVLNGNQVIKTTNINNVSLLTLYKPIILQNEVVGVLQVATIIDDIYTYLNTFQWIYIFSSLILIGIAATVGLFMARKTLKPIENVILAANQIEKSTDLDNRILYEGPNDEIGRLIHTINGMLSRIQIIYAELEDAYRLQRRFVSDASHELRTPLTTIRGNIEFLEKMWQSNNEHKMSEQEKMNLTKESVIDISSEAERMSLLVNDLLSLARADAGYEMEKENISIKPIIEQVIRKAQYLPKSVDFIVDDLELLKDIQVFGNNEYLQQMLFIFIENAFKYTEKGYVELKVKTVENQVGIEITDTGIGMKKEDIPHIFNRFYRADVSRGIKPGTGLGLSIAKWIIEEHSGSVEVLTSLESGTTFIIWIPLVE
ncbi:sensor histidine kinase [Chengkuizengella axinellae]|uniref:histidine kinase n=1 Tax=Chengkuizengella axinellae TaxID=3064388 RepID=A0ABT9J2E7_9BACL|nr:HAMP domain-containing sensor histidine kinase [Chengkuizengella sp. 2205SS18-9]MDP5275174.1 HAMP domain-containing sensor histidine kinase [Chengkuizengella sp. 2205SS18-9]